jgi:hypothetical protein
MVIDGGWAQNWAHSDVRRERDRKAIPQSFSKGVPPGGRNSQIDRARLLKYFQKLWIAWFALLLTKSSRERSLLNRLI